MGTTEPRPSTGAKVRGALPGDSWRQYVSSGAEKAYDGPLHPTREEAHKLARKGRLVAAHKREKAAYKIRVRGYDRKHRGEKPIEKAYTSRSVAVGPVKYATKRLQLRKPTKGEERAEQLKALLGGVGTIKLAAGAGAGALVTDAVKDARDKSQKATRAVKDKIKPSDVEKGWVKDDVAAIPDSENQISRGFVSEQRSKVIKRPTMYTTYVGNDDGGKFRGQPAEIVRMPKHTRKRRKAVHRAYKKTETGKVANVDGVEYKMVKSLEHRITMGSIVTDAPHRIVKADSPALVEITKVFGLGAVKAMASNAYKQGGVRGVLDTARQQYRAPIMPGGSSVADTVRSYAAPAAGAAGVAGAGWGAKKLLQRYAPAVADPLKKKAKKYAMYGAAGAAGTVAAGTAAGNALSPRR